MNISKKKNILALTSVLMAWGPNIVGAHEVNGAGLGSSFTATDVYQITCSTDSGGSSDYLEIRVMDPTPTVGGGKISAVIQKGTTVTTTGDQYRNDGNYSPAASLSAGNTSYLVMVHHLFEGSKIYSLEYHCKNNNGSHTGTSLVTLQNQ